MRRLTSSVLALCFFTLSIANAQAGLVVSGSAEFTFDNNSLLFTGGGGPFIMDRFYGTNVETATTTDVINAVGGDVISIPGSGLVSASANINGLTVSQPTGRLRQITNLDVELTNILGTWSSGEQIGIDAILRTNVDAGFGGGFIAVGDFALVNQGGALRIVNNLQFPAEAFTIGSANVQSTANGFTISGELLSGAGFETLTGGFVPTGTDAGFFSMSVTVVPEPSAMFLLGLGAMGLTLRRRR